MPAASFLDGDSVASGNWSSFAGGPGGITASIAPELSAAVIHTAVAAAASVAASAPAAIHELRMGRLATSGLRRSLGRQLKGGGGGGLRTGDDHPEAAFDTEAFCAADRQMCDADGNTCFYFENNPGGGTISFDNVGAAMIALLQAVTFDTWTDPMFDVMDAYGFWAWTYFIAAAILGGMFVVNLFLAVIFDEFMRTQVHARLSEPSRQHTVWPS